MKKYILTSLAICFLAFSCSSDDETSEVSQEPNTDFSVNNISLEVSQLTTPITPYDPGDYSVWFSKVGNNFIYANPSNTPQPQFMLSYNLENNSFSPLEPHEEVCACGYSSKFVTDGTYIYYIANEAWKYDIINNTWTELNYPASAKENNGEAGIVYKDGKIYFLGGREATSRFKYYEIQSDSWYNSTDFLFAARTSDLTVVDGKIYALGGDEGRKKFSYFQEGLGWSALDELPFEAWNYFDRHTVATFANRLIFVYVNNEINIYDTQEDEWKETPIPLNIANSYGNLFSDDEYLYITSKTIENQFALHKIKVNLE